MEYHYHEETVSKIREQVQIWFHGTDDLSHRECAILNSIVKLYKHHYPKDKMAIRGCRNCAICLECELDYSACMGEHWKKPTESHQKIIDNENAQGTSNVDRF